jgi:hypothetical protein
MTGCRAASPRLTAPGDPHRRSAIAVKAGTPEEKRGLHIAAQQRLTSCAEGQRRRSSFNIHGGGIGDAG